MGSSVVNFISCAWMLDFFFLLVDPLCLHAAPLGNLCLGEPQPDLLLGRLNAVAAVYDVPAHVHAEIPANRPRRRILQGANITPVIRRRENRAGNNEKNFLSFEAPWDWWRRAWPAPAWPRWGPARPWGGRDRSPCSGRARGRIPWRPDPRSDVATGTRPPA